MNLLGIDVGSSSVKAAVLRGGKPRGRVVRAAFETDHWDDGRVEVPAARILDALANAVAELGPAAKPVDAVALSVMSPAWCAMDAKGRALTPLVTHQDRRSVDVAREIERRVGAKRHLRLAGNRPFPGGISSTTWAWFRQHDPRRLARADLVGQLNTYLHRQLTGARVIDPSNASFTGVYSTVTQSGWNDELLDAIGASRSMLPEVRDADEIGGRVTASAATTFGLTEGTPVLVGLIDTSAAMLLARAEPGQLLNVCGSTDVLALCTDRARPHERLLTRALGVVGGDKRRLWMSVSTLAAAGAAFTWAHGALFSDLSKAQYGRLVSRLATRRSRDAGGVGFEPYLAGERTSVEQRRAAFTGLSLANTRQQMLLAVIESLARASAERLERFEELGLPVRREVLVSGGAAEHFGTIFQRDWPGRWRFRGATEASLGGLATLVPRER